MVMTGYVSALLASYALSRLLLRVPLPGFGLAPGTGVARLLVVHAVSAAVLGLMTYALRGWALATVPVAIAQGCWLLLDIVRRRGLTARAW